MPAVTQKWTHDLSMMQQSVLLTSIRGPDGLPKYGSVKLLLRWLRRCVLLSAMDGGEVIENPIYPKGGSFTGPSLFSPNTNYGGWEPLMMDLVGDYIQSLDAVPHHFQLHFIHAVEILGYKHPVPRIRKFWNQVYLRLVLDMHLYPESENQLDERLGDSRENWLKHADSATTS